MEENMYNSNEVYNDLNDPNPKSGRTGLAVAALVMGIISLVLCCCGLGFICAPLGIIFGIVSLATGRGGTGMAITGIVLSAITAVILIVFCASCGTYIKDYVKFVGDAENVIEEYQETGELPDYLEKYTDEEYDEIWESAGYDDFYGFFDDIIEKSGLSKSSGTSQKNNSSKDEKVVDLSFLMCC